MNSYVETAVAAIFAIAIGVYFYGLGLKRSRRVRYVYVATWTQIELRLVRVIGIASTPDAGKRLAEEHSFAEMFQGQRDWQFRDPDSDDRCQLVIRDHNGAVIGWYIVKRWPVTS